MTDEHAPEGPDQGTVQWSVLEGDCRERLLNLDAQSVQTCVTSPPYYGLRDYGHDGQIGHEETPASYVAALVEVFREVRRVLADDGTLWLNLGDSYAAAPTGSRASEQERGKWDGGFKVPTATQVEARRPGHDRRVLPGIKQKDLLGIPWMTALALREDGWYLRDEIIWHKTAPMPSSAKDRCCRAHEQVFLLSKQARYFYDYEAILEPHADPNHARPNFCETQMDAAVGHLGRTSIFRNGYEGPPNPNGVTRRSVWTIGPAPFSGAHFATFPPKLAERCILAGSRESDTVLDPFAGAGTTGLVALRRNRSFVGCELNPDYAELARNRIRDDAPLLNVGAEAA